MVQLNQDFINKIANEIPSHLTMDDFVHYCSLPLRPSIRVNTLKISVEDFLALMTPKGWHFEAIPWSEAGFWVTFDSESQIGNSVEHLQGLFYIQEASSMMPPFAIAEELAQSQLVLDMAAAPGSKTTQIAAIMNNQGTLVANEYSSSRVKVLHANLARMGVSNTVITHFDARVFGEYQYETFDTILLDAPCGGEGTVRKDPDALKNWSQTDVDHIAATQRDLIESAFYALKPGGTLIYSTCTLNATENQAVCHHLKQTFPDAASYVSLKDLFPDADRACTQEGFLHIWPQIYDSEGFFVAKIQKTASVPRQKSQPKQQRKFPFAPASQKQKTAICDYFDSSLDIQLPDQSNIQVRDDEFWLFPNGFEEITGKMRYQRVGIKLADHAKHGFTPRHEAIMALSCGDNAKVELSYEQSRDYLMGKDLQLTDITKAKGDVIVCYQNKVLGAAKHLGHRIKNKLPRDLVKDKVLCLPS